MSLIGVMVTISAPVAAMMWGLLSTSLLNLANAMQRHGIDIFDQIRTKLNISEEEAETDLKKPTIYIVGVLLNQTPPIWAILANATGAPPSYYTSTFGLGLVILLLYSTKILKEEIRPLEYVGAAILILGTLILGYDGIIRPELDMSLINITTAFIFIGVFSIAGIIGMVIGLKENDPKLIGILFGLFAGGLGCLDPVLKGIGQNYQEAGGLPVDFIGWVIFLLSFLLGFLAFILTQWGFARKADASSLIPAFNSTFVVVPIIIQILALPGFDLHWITIGGLVVTVLGITIMTSNHEYKPETTNTT